MIRENNAPWFTKAGAATGIMPISHFVSETVFALKGGGYGCLFSLAGIDEESRTDEDLDVRVRGVEASLRGLPPGACLYQYTRVMAGFSLPRQKTYTDPITESFANDRIEFLNQNARFRRIDLHWCITLEPETNNPLSKKPREQRDTNDRQLFELEKVATILESHMGDSIGLTLLRKERVFQFFSYLFNLEEWATDVHLRSDVGVDRQLVKAPVEWQSEHLRIGRRYVQMFPLTNTPEISRPCLFTNLMELDCDSILCSVWRPKTDSATRKEVTNQEKFLEFFKLSPFQRLMSGKNTAPLEATATAKAVAGNVDNLTEVVSSLDKLGQGEYALRLLLSAGSASELCAAIPAVHRLFVDVRAPIMEETYGNLSAFYAMFPGNRQFNVYPLWLREDHHARLSSIFAPNLGHVHSDDLDAEYLNISETRTRTPYFQDAYVNGVRVQLIIGPTGTGKSVHANQMLSLEQKYGGFTFIFDIGGSYESVVELYGGKIDRVGKDGPRINPFALEPTETNVAFLHSFVKLLLTNSGASIGPEDDDDVFKSVKGIYNLPHAMRRLGNLTLPKHLDRYMAKWKDQGVYYAIFDNVEDSLRLSRLQCFDFQGVNNKQYADLIEPLMVWILRRIDEIVYDPKNLGVPKHVLIEEIFSNMKNKQLLEGALASIKTVRKNLGGVTMIGQSANDLGENADSIVNSCTSFLFLPDATFNRRFYGELFKLSKQQLDLLEGLRPREGLYVRRDGITKVITLNLDSRSYAKFSPSRKTRFAVRSWLRSTGFTKVSSGSRRAKRYSSFINQNTRGHVITLRLFTFVTAVAIGSAVNAQTPHLQPSAPRTVVTADASAPPVVRAGLLQSTLIELPAEEKVATVFGGDTVSWVFDAGHVASRYISIKPKVADSTTDLHIVSDHGNEYTIELKEISGDKDNPRFDSKVYVTSSDSKAAENIAKSPVFIPAAEAEAKEAQLKKEAEDARKAAEADHKTVAAAAESYKANYPGTLHFDYTWDQKKGAALGIEQIWRDDKFTYLRGKFQETPALYELKDGKGSLINFDFANGLYTIPKTLVQGYLSIGKQRVDFRQIKAGS